MFLVRGLYGRHGAFQIYNIDFVELFQIQFACLGANFSSIRRIKIPPPWEKGKKKKNFK